MTGAWSRRRALAALSAALLVGCAGRAAPIAAAPSGPLRLGWRWIPGQILDYKATVERALEGRTERLAQRWSYLVRAVSPDGIATLEGHLTGVGGLADLGDPPLEPAALERALARARAGRTATLRIGSDGRLHPVLARSCDELGLPLPPCFEVQIVHRLLALTLPARPVDVHDAWDDPTLAAPFEALLPPEIDRTRTSSARVLELALDGRGTPTAILGSVASIRAEPGPTLRAEGQATWDLARGRLLAREVWASLAGPGGADTPGRLRVQLELAR